jgi:uncharacterized protein YxjI
MTEDEVRGITQMFRRHHEQSEESQQIPPTAGPQRYQMREKILSIGDDFWIENDRGQKAYKVDGKALRVRNTLKLEDARHHVVAEVQERALRVRDSMAIERDGYKIGEVHKRLINPLREHFSVDLAGNGPGMDVQGNILDHEYRITQGRQTVAEVSKKWFRVRDTYGIEIEPGYDEPLILTIAICLDQMARN